MDKIIKKDIVNGVEYKYNGIGGGGSITENNVIYISQADYDNLTPAEKADATKNYVIIGAGGIPVPTEINAEDVNFDNTGTGMQSDNVQDAIEEVFQSVSNGKTLIAAAITDKGVSTAASDSFQTMASNIESLTVGGKYTEGSSGDVLYVMDLDADGYSCYSTMQSEDGDNVYYYAGCLKRVGYDDYRYVVIKYNATENKMYTASFNSSTAVDTGGSKLDNFKFYKDGEKVWFCYRNDNWSDPSRYVIFGYFDSTNQFTQESTGADTSNNITQGCDTWSSGTTSRKIENTLGSRKFIIMAVGGSGTPAVLIVV